MKISRTEGNVQCPFYRYDEADRHRIVCEGIVDRSTLMLNYTYKKDYRLQLETFCCEHFRKCEVYRMLMEKYREEG